MGPLARYLIFITLFSVLFYLMLLYNPSELKTLAALYMWTPALSAALAYASWEKLKRALGRPTKLALGLGVALPFVHLMLLYLLLNGYWVDPSAVMYLLYGKSVPLQTLLLEALAFGPTVNAAVAVGEEIGWRGLMYEELKGGRLKKSLVIGAVWGLWHWPFIAFGYNFPQSKLLGLVPFMAFTVTTTYALLFLRDLDGIWSSAIAHGTINALGGLEALAFVQLPDYLRPPAGLYGALGWALVDAALFLSEFLLKLRRSPQLVRRVPLEEQPPTRGHSYRHLLQRVQGL